MKIVGILIFFILGHSRVIIESDLYGESLDDGGEVV